MKQTSKPFSTIWFGSSEFLEMVLNEQLKLGNVLFWAYIKHHKEDDEKKNHIHLYIEPNGKIDVSSLANIMTEYDLVNVEPIKPLPFKSSKFGDWFMYCSHNKLYLASKGQSRKYTYSRDDFKSSNDDFLLELIHQIDMSKINKFEIISDAVEKGIAFESLVANGQIPIQLISQYRQAYQMLLDLANGLVYTVRYNNVKTHD